MTEVTTIVHLPLSILFLLVAGTKLYSYRRTPRGYSSLWLGMLFLGFSEAFNSALVYGHTDSVLGPGWGLIANHTFFIIGVGFAFNAMYFITGRSIKDHIDNAALTCGAVLFSIAPWLIDAPEHASAAIAAYPIYFDGNWQTTVHWVVAMAYLILRTSRYIQMCWTQAIMLRGEGSLVTGLVAMCVAQMFSIAADFEAVLFQGVWLLGHGPQLFPLFVTSNTVLLALALALLGAAVGWPYTQQRWQHLTSHRAWSRSRRNLSLLHERWAWLTAEIPEVVVFPESITGSPINAEEMRWQRSRMVTEIYDVQRRLSPHYGVEDYEHVVQTIAAHNLPSERAQAAVEHACLCLALDRYRAGAFASRVHQHFTTPSLTTEGTAMTIARKIRLTRDPATAAVIANTIREGQTW